MLSFIENVFGVTTGFFAWFVDFELFRTHFIRCLKD